MREEPPVGSKESQGGLEHLPPHLPADVRWPVVLGIDPGTRALGYGALVVARGGPRFLAAGVLRTAPRASIPERLAWLNEMLAALCQRLRPATVVVELAFSARNVQSALRIGEARGVVLAVAAGSGAEVVQLAPAAAKKAVTGHGSAAKHQVAEMVTRSLGMRQQLSGLDASDALALALAHVRRSSFEAILGDPRARVRAALRVPTGRARRSSG